MTDLKMARFGLLLGTLALCACGTKFKAVSLTSGIEATSAPGVMHPPPPPPMPLTEATLPDLPSALNTGIPANLTLKASTGLTITTPGTVIDGLEIHGAVHINASNVTLKRSRITVANYVVVSIDADLVGVVVEDCEIDGIGSDNSGAMGIEGPGTFLRNNIHHVQSGIVPNSGALIQDNYIHDLMASGTPDYNGVQIDGGASNVLIHHNSILINTAETSAVMIDNFFGPVANVTVSDNLLGGGAHTVVVDASQSSDAVAGISITGNSFRAGTLGYTLFNHYTPIFSGNFDDVSGAPIP